MSVAPRWLRGSDRRVPHHDSGLQAERTAMAWQRTALGVGAVSALLLHRTGGGLLEAVPGLLGLGVAVLLLVLTEVRYEITVHRVGRGRDTAAAPLVGLLAGTVALLAVLAAGLLLVQGPW